MNKKQIQEIVKLSQINHNTLIKTLNSKKGENLAGKWVAVTKRKLFSDMNFKKALKKAKNIESQREKILLVKVPNKNTHSLRF